MGLVRKCVVNLQWLKEYRFLWENPMFDNKNSAYCEMCNANIALNNMGKKALESHMLSKKHKEIILKETNKPLFDKESVPAIAAPSLSTMLLFRH